VNEEQQFQKLARRVKWRRWGITIGLILVIMIGGGLAFVQMTRVKAKRASDEINRSFDVINAVLSPNIQISDQFLENSDFFGGTVVSHRYKEIDGAHENWSANRGPYTWLLGRGGGFSNAADITDTAAYDRVTQHKIPLFYNVDRQKSEVQRAHEVRQVVRQKHYLAEVALTFDHRLTLQQIKAKLPAGVHANWYWAGVSGKADATMMDNNFIGFQGANQAKFTAENYRWFRHEALSTASGMTYNGFDVLAYANRFAKRYPKLEQAKFAGVIVTGKSAAFKPLTQAKWVATSSVGYFQPDTGIK